MNYAYAEREYIVNINRIFFSQQIFLARNPSLGAPYGRRDSGNKSLQVGMDDDNKRFAVHIVCSTCVCFGNDLNLALCHKLRDNACVVPLRAKALLAESRNDPDKRDASLANRRFA